MSHKDKLVYINAIKDRYINSNKEEKKIILDEFCKVCNYNRKYEIRILKYIRYYIFQSCSLFV